MTHETRTAFDPTALTLRDERADDAADIDAVTLAAFRDHPFSQQTEHRIVRGLRDSGGLALSLVATLHGTVVAHAAASAVTVDGRDVGLCGLGPVSVTPAHQRRGIGAALLRQLLTRLRERGAAGCVVLGDPAYYGRFGFAPRPGLIYPGPPADHFMALMWREPAPVGVVAYHPAFGTPP